MSDLKRFTPPHATVVYNRTKKLITFDRCDPSVGGYSQSDADVAELVETVIGAAKKYKCDIDGWIIWNARADAPEGRDKGKPYTVAEFTKLANSDELALTWRHKGWLRASLKIGATPRVAAVKKDPVNVRIGK